METRIIGNLKWKMRAITPLCFIPFYLIMVEKPETSYRSIQEIIIQSHGDINFTRFKPSVIAASALLTRYPELKEHVLAFETLKQEPVPQCLDLMQMLCKEKNNVAKSEISLPEDILSTKLVIDILQKYMVMKFELSWYPDAANEPIISIMESEELSETESEEEVEETD